ncbi:uncharacterized protein LOC135498014 [Lineus longissimus]|uniref:uncharacterized protein LOC135498014 n=1 Tax=Lineus longissimus TaxID=88925 RepID=UPI00315CDBE9
MEKNSDRDAETHRSYADVVSEKKHPCIVINDSDDEFADSPTWTIVENRKRKRHSRLSLKKRQKKADVTPKASVAASVKVEDKRPVKIGKATWKTLRHAPPSPVKKTKTSAETLRTASATTSTAARASPIGGTTPAVPSHNNDDHPIEGVSRNKTDRLIETLNSIMAERMQRGKYGLPREMTEPHEFRAMERVVKPFYITINTCTCRRRPNNAGDDDDEPRIPPSQIPGSHQAPAVVDASAVVSVVDEPYEIPDFLLETISPPGSPLRRVSQGDQDTSIQVPLIDAHQQQQQQVDANSVECCTPPVNPIAGLPVTDDSATSSELLELLSGGFEMLMETCDTDAPLVDLLHGAHDSVGHSGPPDDVLSTLFSSTEVLSGTGERVLQSDKSPTEPTAPLAISTTGTDENQSNRRLCENMQWATHMIEELANGQRFLEPLPSKQSIILDAVIERAKPLHTLERQTNDVYHSSQQATTSAAYVIPPSKRPVDFHAGIKQGVRSRVEGNRPILRSLLSEGNIPVHSDVGDRYGKGNIAQKPLKVQNVPERTIVHQSFLGVGPHKQKVT